MHLNKQSQKELFTDVSLWVLLFSNIVTIFFAINEGWNLLTIMWIYWFQSIVIGFFNFIRILQLKEFSTEGFTINDQQVEPTRSTKIYTAFFFIFHYGFFHFVYLIFLLDDFSRSYVQGFGLIDLKYIFLVALVFFVNHLFSYIYNRPRDTKKQNIGSLMFYPYARIIPMHFTIILGATFSGALLFFLIFKTVADVAMHSIEHQVLRKGEA